MLHLLLRRAPCPDAFKQHFIPGLGLCSMASAAGAQPPRESVFPPNEGDRYKQSRDFVQLIIKKAW